MPNVLKNIKIPEIKISKVQKIQNNKSKSKIKSLKFKIPNVLKNIKIRKIKIPNVQNPEQCKNDQNQEKVQIAGQPACSLKETYIFNYCASNWGHFSTWMRVPCIFQNASLDELYRRTQMQAPKMHAVRIFWSFLDFELSGCKLGAFLRKFFSKFLIYLNFII